MNIKYYDDDDDDDDDENCIPMAPSNCGFTIQPRVTQCGKEI